MPTYEYRCNACGREFEYVQRMVEDDKVTCEACGKDALERLISRTAFQFKGGGWYKDLYSSAKPEGAKAEGGDKASTGSSDASTTPAATPSTPATPAAPSAGSGSSGGASSGGSSSGGSSSGSSSGGSSSGSSSGGSSSGSSSGGSSSGSGGSKAS